jgi:hypothetical protein
MKVPDDIEVDPDALVTVKIYAPGTSADIVAITPVPAIAPRFIVQVPAVGRPLNTTLPLSEVQVV